MSRNVEESDTDIAREIRSKARRQSEIDRKGKLFAEEVKDFWRSVAPIRTGAYAGSIHVVRGRFKTREGLPAYKVRADDFKAHWIEFGTGGDTPTREFACRGKTAARFGGTEDDAELTAEL